MTPADLFETFRESAFRLETRQNYVLAEDEPRRQAFRERRPLPPRPGKTESMHLVREAVAAGRRVSRVHVVELPLSEYITYELAVYPENVKAGEDVRIAVREDHPELRELDVDFWLFDADGGSPAVIWFRYTPAGELIRHDYSDMADDVQRARGQRDLALAHSVALKEFKARPTSG